MITWYHWHHNQRDLSSQNQYSDYDGDRSDGQDDHCDHDNQVHNDQDHEDQDHDDQVHDDQIHDDNPDHLELWSARSGGWH